MLEHNTELIANIDNHDVVSIEIYLLIANNQFLDISYVIVDDVHTGVSYV